MMWCGSLTLVILGNSPNKSLFGEGTILDKIMEPYSGDLLCDNFFEMTWYDGIQ